MKETSRNVAVGITVIVALALLAAMILMFAGLPEMFQRGYEIEISSWATHDAHEGDVIHLSGMRVGRLTSIRFADPDRPTEGVRLIARIDGDIRLPGNAKAFFFGRGVMGGTYLAIKGEGEPVRDPKTGEALEFFPTDRSIVMESVQMPSSLLPAELTDAMKSLSKLADNLNKLLAPPEEPPATGPVVPGQPPTTAAAPKGLRGTIEKLNRTLDAISTVLGDVENQENIKTSLANLSKATAAATEAMGSLQAFAEQARKTAADAQTTVKDFSELAVASRQRMDELSMKLIEDAEQISKLMTTINRIASKIDSGEGTAGKLLTDPELYNSFLAATRQLNELMRELRQLVEGWKTSGVEIKLK